MADLYDNRSGKARAVSASSRPSAPRAIAIVYFSNLNLSIDDTYILKYYFLVFTFLCLTLVPTEQNNTADCDDRLKVGPMYTLKTEY